MTQIKAHQATARTRILHLIGQLGAGGAERFVVDLLLEMRARGLDVELACLVGHRDGPGERWEKTLQEAGVPLHFGPGRRAGPEAVIWLQRLLTGSDIALVNLHLHYVEIRYYLARFLHRRRYAAVRTVHNTHPISQYGSLARWAFHHSDIRHSIACGQSCFDAYAANVRGEFTCVPNGITFDWPRHDPEQRNARQHALGIDQGRTHYLCVGSFMGDRLGTAQKGHDLLLRAWRQGNLSARGGTLHLVGDGALRQQAEQLARGDEQVIFHGTLPNVREWMSAVDTFVMPSRWEGLPIAGIEAVGTGLPCLFSDLSSLRELGSSAARYFPVGDQEALTARLVERLGARDTASTDNVESTRERYGVAGACDGYLAVYSRALAAAGVPSSCLPERAACSTR